jgi:arylsulfatase
VTSPAALPAGKATIELDFAYDGGGLGKGGVATLSVNGRQVAQGRIERTQPMIFSADETADVGIDLGTPVVESVGAEGKSRFDGRIPRVTIAVRDGSPQADAEVEKAWHRLAAHIE